ncbi:MAG: hypothetical protein C0501_11255 [Isosphaera sp.]|nr:hypothetical protein [Isosphaera sp.]
MPGFRHDGRPGAFRTRLRAIVTYAVRDHLRRRAAGDDRLLAELEDLGSELNARWDAEHDRHVLRGLMHLARPEFTKPTRRAFLTTPVDGRRPRSRPNSA